MPTILPALNRRNCRVICMQSGIVYNIQRMSGHDGPGLRTTVFLKGCPLQCRWCSNPESQSLSPQLMLFQDLCTGCGLCVETCPEKAIAIANGKAVIDRIKCVNCGQCEAICLSKARVISGKRMTVNEVMNVVCKDELFYFNSGGGVTFCGGEPTMAGNFLLALQHACRSHGYHVCLDTCGQCPTEKFREFVKLSDLVLFDIKHMDPEMHKDVTGVDNRLILENLREIVRLGVPYRIRIPLIPGLNDTEENIKRLAVLLKEFCKDEVDVLPCHAFGKNKYAALSKPEPTYPGYSPEALKNVLKYFDAHNLHTIIV